MRKKLAILGEYVGHLAIGAGMFAALLLFGGSLNRLVHVTSPMIGDDSFTELMKVVEKVILCADIAFILWWAIYSTYKAIRDMIQEKGDDQ